MGGAGRLWVLGRCEKKPAEARQLPLSTRRLQSFRQRIQQQQLVSPRPKMTCVRFAFSLCRARRRKLLQPPLHKQHHCSACHRGHCCETWSVFPATP